MKIKNEYLMRNIFIFCMLALIAGCRSDAIVAENAEFNSSLEYSGVLVCKNNLALLNEKTAKLLSLPDNEFEIKSGITKLEAYSAQSNAMSVTTLLENQAISGKKYTDQNIKNALFASASAGSVEVITALLNDSDSRINSELIKRDDKNSVVIAGYCGHLASLETLLKFGFSPNETDQQGFDAMMAAIMDANVDIAKLLISRGYDSCKNRTAKGQHVKELAIAQSQTEIARLLKDCGK